MSASLYRIVDVLIERDEDGFYVARSPQIPGIADQGKTEQEALANYQRAFWFTLECEGVVQTPGRERA